MTAEPSAQAKVLSIDDASVVDWLGCLPDWFAGLSAARGQIVIDQVRGVLERAGRCEGFMLESSTGATRPPTMHDSRPITSPLIFLISTDERGTRWGILAAQSLSIPADTPQGHLGDTATILHAGCLPAGSTHADVPPAKSLSEKPGEPPPELLRRFDQVLTRRGVRFIQWATDPVAASQTVAAVTPCRQMGMQVLATLDYLCAPLDQLSPPTAKHLSPPTANHPRGCSGETLQLVPLAWQDATSLRCYETLVERTYQQTADCPGLSKYRTAAQTLKGYRSVDSFDPDRWYTVVSTADPQNPIGCVVMASHTSQNTSGKMPSPPTSELVYMALVPEVRGRGWGHAVVTLAVSEPARRFKQISLQSSSPPQLVLAVDQQNVVVRRMYENAGLKRVLSETIWCRSIGDTFSTTS